MKTMLTEIVVYSHLKSGFIWKMVDWLVLPAGTFAPSPLLLGSAFLTHFVAAGRSGPAKEP